MSAVVDGGGNTVKGRSRWFPIRLTDENAPWAFASEGQPFRLIASLEALGVLLSFVAFGPQEPDADTTFTTIVPGFTDNRGNSFALNKLMMTQLPLCCIVLELAARMDEATARAGLAWVPRDSNVEADALSASITDGCNPD